MAERDTTSQGRRRFLATVLIGGGAVAGAATVGVRLTPQTPSAPDGGTPRAAAPKQGYRETAHVRRYYESARG